MCLALFSVFVCTDLQAQVQDSVANRKPRRTRMLMDDFAAQNPHDPNRALRMSAMLPGAGQVYNHQAWKVPIIYAALGGVGYNIFFNLRYMKDYREEYLYRVKHFDTPRNSDFANLPTANVYNLYEAYNKSFQLSIIVFVAFYGVNIVDAYVFAHLFDIKIDDDIALNITPSLQPSMDFNAFGQSKSSGAFSALKLTPSATLTLKF